MNVFVISDTHFNHDNVIKYCSRPFKNIETMNEAIIANWNKVVGEDDIVYFLGDFSFGGKENVAKFASKLNGYKILIKGNHDYSDVNIYLKAGFCEVYRGILEINWGDTKLALSHKPIPDTKILNIHGHMHNKNTSNPLHVNVSVEQINYTPQPIEDIINKAIKN